MAFQRICTKVLPDGTVSKVFPFHVCTKGQEDRVIFRDDDDLKMAHNMIPVCAKRANVIIVMDCVLTTHIHAMVLSGSYDDAKRFIDGYKQSASMVLAKKYGTGKMYFQDVESRPVFLEDNYHVRNTICYIPRNSLNMGIKVDEYRWSSYRVMFCEGKFSARVRNVAEMTGRETRALFKTGDSLKVVPWKVTDDGIIEPASYCDWRYAEEAFNHDISFFMRILGTADDDSMEEILVNKPTIMLSSEELMKEIEVRSIRQFGVGPSLLTMEQKIPLIKTIYHSCKTTAAQIARCFGVQLEKVMLILKKK